MTTPATPAPAQGPGDLTPAGGQVRPDPFVRGFAKTPPGEEPGPATADASGDDLPEE